MQEKEKRKKLPRPNPIFADPQGFYVGKLPETCDIVRDLEQEG